MNSLDVERNWLSVLAGYGLSAQQVLERKGYTHQVQYVEHEDAEPTLFVTISCPWVVGEVVLKQGYLPKVEDKEKNTYNMERNGFLEADAVRDAYLMYYEKLKRESK